LSTIVLGANRIKESLVVVIGAVDPVEKGLFQHVGRRVGLGTDLWVRS
jgi:hypothetical protein